MSSISSFSKISPENLNSEKPNETKQKILLNSSQLILGKNQLEPELQFPLQLSVEHQAMIERGIVTTNARLTNQAIQNLQPLPKFNLETKRLLAEFLKETTSFTYDQKTVEISRAEQIVYLKKHSSSLTIYNGTFLKGGLLAEIMCQGGYLEVALQRLDFDPAQRKKWLTADRLHAVKRRAPDGDMHTYFPIAQKKVIETTLVELFHRHLLEKIPPDPAVEPGKRAFLVKRAFKRPKKFWLDGIRFAKLVFTGSRNPVDWSLIQASERPSLYLHHALQVSLDDFAQAIYQEVPEEAWPDVKPTLLSFDVVPKSAPLEVQWQALVSLYLNFIHFNDFSTINRFASSGLFSCCTMGMCNGEPDLEKELFNSLLKFFSDKEDIPLRTRFIERMAAMIGKKINYLDSISSDIPFVHLWNSLEFLDKFQLDPEILEAIAKKIIKNCKKPVSSLARFLHLLATPTVCFQDLKICLQLLSYSLLQNPKNKNDKVILRVTQHGDRAIIRLKTCDSQGDILIPAPKKDCFRRFVEVAERLQAVPQWKYAFSQVMRDLWDITGFKLVPFTEDDSKRAAASQIPLLKFMQLLMAKQEMSKEGLLPYLMTFSDAFTSRPDPSLMNLWMTSLRNFFANSRNKAFKSAANRMEYFSVPQNISASQKKVMWVTQLIKCREEIFSKEAWRLWKLDPTLSSEIELVSLMLEEGGNGLTYALAMWSDLLPIEKTKRERALRLWIASAQKASKESAPRVLHLIATWEEHHSYFVVPKELKLELHQAILALGERLPIGNRAALFNLSVKAGWLDIKTDEAIQLISTLTHNFHQWPCLVTAYQFVNDTALWTISKAFYSDSLIVPAIEVLALKLYEKSYFEEGDDLFIQLALKSSERISDSSRAKIKERLETIQEEKGDLVLQKHRLFLAFESPDLLLSRTFLNFESNLDHQNHEQAFLDFREICKHASPKLKDSLRLAWLLAAAPEGETTLENLRVVSGEKGVSEAIKGKKEMMVEMNCLLLKRLFLENKNECSLECFKMASKILQHIHLNKVGDSVREVFVPLLIQIISRFWKPEISFPSQLAQALNTALTKLFACLPLKAKLELYFCLKVHFPVPKLHLNLISAQKEIWVEFLASHAEHPAVEKVFGEIKNSGLVEKYWKPLLIWIEGLYATRPVESIEWLLWLGSTYPAIELSSDELFAWKDRLKGTLDLGRLALVFKSKLPKSEASADWLEEALDLYNQNNLPELAWELIDFLSIWQNIDQFPSLFNTCQKQFRVLLDKGIQGTPQTLTVLQVFFPLFSEEWELLYREVVYLSDLRSIAQCWEALLSQTVKCTYHPAALCCWAILFKDCFQGEQKQLWWTLIDTSCLNLLKERFTRWNQKALLEKMFAELFELGIDCFETAQNQEEQHELLISIRQSCGAIKEEVVFKWIKLLISLKKPFSLRTALEILSENTNRPALREELYDALEMEPTLLKDEKNQKKFNKMVIEEPVTSDLNVFLRILKKVDTVDSVFTALFIITRSLDQTPVEESHLNHFIASGIRTKNLHARVANLLKLPQLVARLGRTTCLEWSLKLTVEEIKEAAKNKSASFSNSVKLILNLLVIEKEVSLLTEELFQEVLTPIIAILIRAAGRSEELDNVAETVTFIQHSLTPVMGRIQSLQMILTQEVDCAPIALSKEGKLSRAALFLIEWLITLLDWDAPASETTEAIVLAWIEKGMRQLLPAIADSECMDTIVQKFFLNPRFFNDVFFTKSIEILKEWYRTLDEERPSFLALTIFLCDGKKLFHDIPVEKQSCVASEVMELLAKNKVMAFDKAIAIFKNISTNTFAITSNQILRWFETLLMHWRNLSVDKIKTFFNLFNCFTPIKFRLENNFELMCFEAVPIENFKTTLLFPVFGEMLLLAYKELMHEFKDKKVITSAHLPPFDPSKFIPISLSVLASKELFLGNIKKYFEIFRSYKEYLINQIDSDASWGLKHEQICDVLKLHANPLGNQIVVDENEGTLIARGYVEWVERVLSHPVVKRNCSMKFRLVARENDNLCQHSPRDLVRLGKLLAATSVEMAPVKQRRGKNGKNVNLK